MGPGAEQRYSPSGSQTPAGFAIEVTPAVTVLSLPSRAVYVGTTGDLVVTMAAENQQVTFVNIQGGSMLPIRVRSVDAGTTAGNVIAVY